MDVGEGEGDGEGVEGLNRSGDAAEHELDRTTPFALVAKLFEKVSTRRRVESKHRLLRRWWELYRDRNAFPCLRLFVPERDTDREYGLKEAGLARLYIDALSIPRDSGHGAALLQWRDPAHAGPSAAGNFAMVVGNVAEHYASVEKGTLSIREVNALLDELASAAHAGARASGDDGGGGGGGAAARVKVWRRVVREMGVLEQKWLVQIVLKTLKLGVGFDKRLETFHSRAPAVFAVTVSLAAMVQQVFSSSSSDGAGGDKMLTDELQGAWTAAVPGVRPLAPFMPMLAAAWRASSGTASGGLPEGGFSIETKFDGERLQLHCQGDTFRLFSRNRVDVTRMYGPELVPHMRAALRSNTDVVLDGELVLWNDRLKQIEPFGSLRARVRAPVPHLWPFYNVFDVVYVGGRGDVTQLPYAERRKLLAELLPTPVVHRVEVVSARQCTREEEEEGVMVKALAGMYQLGARNQEWLKVKPDYVGALADPLDLLILGAYRAKGARQGGSFNAFLVGAIAFAADSGRGDKDAFASSSGGDGAGGDLKGVRMLTVSKVGSGCTSQLLREIDARLGVHWRRFSRAAPPPHLASWGPAASEIPDVWVPPRMSVVLEVQASELVRSHHFEAGITLRFPRARRLRPDKAWHETLSHARLQEMLLDGARSPSRALIVREDGGVGTDSKHPRKRRKIAGGDVEGRRVGASKLKVLPQFRSAADGSNDGQVDSLGTFAGLNVCVTSGVYKQPASSKAALERLLIQGGASVVQNPTLSTDFLVGPSCTSLKVRNWITAAAQRSGLDRVAGSKSRTKRAVPARQLAVGDKDVLHHSWVLESAEAGVQLPLEPRFVLHATPGRAATLRLVANEWGDKHGIPTSPTSLRKVLDAIQPEKLELVGLELASQELEAVLPLRPLEGTVLYFDIYSVVGVPATQLADGSGGGEAAASVSDLWLRSRIARGLGARVQGELDAEVSHVIVSSRDRTRFPVLRTALARLQGPGRPGMQGRLVVSQQWVDECLAERTRVPEEQYVVRLEQLPASPSAKYGLAKPPE